MQNLALAAEDCVYLFQSCLRIKMAIGFTSNCLVALPFSFTYYSCLVFLMQKLSLVNGVLFTGGSEKQGVYFETIKKVFQVDFDFEYSCLSLINLRLPAG